MQSFLNYSLVYVQARRQGFFILKGGENGMETQCNNSSDPDRPQLNNKVQKTISVFITLI